MNGRFLNVRIIHSHICFSKICFNSFQSKEVEIYLYVIQDNCRLINLTWGRLSFHSTFLPWLPPHHPTSSGPSARCHHVNLSPREKEETSLKWTRSFTFSLWVTWRSYLWALSPCAQWELAEDQLLQMDSMSGLFPHIKLSLCQMSCHQIWCCKEIAIIFIRFFFFLLWPVDFIQSTENPSRWFREHVSSKSIGPTMPDFFLLFSLRGKGVHVLELELFMPRMGSEDLQPRCI